MNLSLFYQVPDPGDLCAGLPLLNRRYPEPQRFGVNHNVRHEFVRKPLLAVLSRVHLPTWRVWIIYATGLPGFINPVFS